MNNSATDLDFGDMMDEQIAANTNAAPSDPAAHLDTFRAPDIDGETFAEDDPVMVGEDGEVLGGEPERMSRAAFCALWGTIWNIPGMIVSYLKPLQITDDKKAASDEAADAAYDLIEAHFPRLLLSSNDTFASVARMLPFILMQAGAFNAIMAERKRAKIEAMKPVNGNRAPEFKTRREGAQEAANKNAAPGPVDWMDAEEAA